MLYWVRWFSLPSFVFGVFMATGMLAEVPIRLLGLWEDLWVGILCAFTWVLTAYLVAPEKKVAVTCVLFLLGALLEWELVGHSWYPEGHAKAYQVSHIPFALTCVSGLVTLLLLAMREKLKNQPRGPWQPRKLGTMAPVVARRRGRWSER